MTFGTGYSSLSYLRRFPIDELKIDRSFINDIHTNPDDAAIAGAIVAMARSLGLSVVAEGVEKQEQADLLSALGCNQVQGYYLRAPHDGQRLCRAPSGTAGKSPMSKLSPGGPYPTASWPCCWGRPVWTIHAQ